MTFLMILLLIVAALSVASVRLLVRDGRGPQRPPVSHFEDPRFRGPPGALNRSTPPQRHEGPVTIR